MSSLNDNLTTLSASDNLDHTGFDGIDGSTE